MFIVGMRNNIVFIKGQVFQEGIKRDDKKDRFFYYNRCYDSYYFVGENRGIFKWVIDGNKTVNCYGQEYNRFYVCVSVDEEYLDEVVFKVYFFKVELEDIQYFGNGGSREVKINEREEGKKVEYGLVKILFIFDYIEDCEIFYKCYQINNKERKGYLDMESFQFRNVQQMEERGV